MFSKLDGLECQDGKRDSGNRKSSFLIRDILEEGDVSEEELCVDRLPGGGAHPHHPPAASALLGLQQGIAVWDQPIVPAAYPVVAAPLSSHEEQVLFRGHQRSAVCSGNLTLCCLNCPPQSWHPGFTDIISPTPTAAVACAAAAAAAAMLPPSAAAGVNAAASTAVSWSCLGGGTSELHQVSGKDAAAAAKGGGGPPRKVRRNRTVFTELQLMGLERRFDCQKYLSTPDRAELARALGLTQLQVKTWYQNRRMKWKKQVMQGGCTVPPTKPKGRPKKNSIPSLNDSQNRVAELGLKDGF